MSRALRASIGALWLAGPPALVGCGGASSPPPAVLYGQISARAAASNPVAVSPQPQTADASPGTQISFLGSSSTTVSAVRVLGSRTGLHTGVLRAYSTGQGESFLPARPFAPGERVSVSARVSSAGATRSARTSFTIASQAAVNEKEFPINQGERQAVQHYSTAPSLTPSTVRLSTPPRPGASPGDLFLAPYQGEGSAGPMIVDQSGNLVWFHPLAAGQSATNFSVQQYQGKPALVWWQGRIIEVGFGQGEDVIYDSSYQQVARVRAGNGYLADLHEIRLTPQGTAWIDVFDPVHMDISAYGGASNGIILDSVVQEIDVRTGLVMWEWHALGHIPASESHNPPQEYVYPWDYAHVNSVDPGSSGDVLLSARNTWALYDVDLRSGGVRWRIGGTHSTFTLGPGVRFYWQHDAELQPGGRISVFDNGSDPPKEKQSRGLLLGVNRASRTVTLEKAFVNPSKVLLASSQGNTLSLPGGNWMLGYGGLPNFTEFDSAGRVLLDGTLGKNVQDFRTGLSPWSGHPSDPPSVLARASAAGGLEVSVSWNGASEVVSWRVLEGSTPGSLAPVASALKTGFQSTILAPGSGPYVEVQALDASGAVIGSSAVTQA